MEDNKDNENENIIKIKVYMNNEKFEIINFMKKVNILQMKSLLIKMKAKNLSDFTIVRLKIGRKLIFFKELKFCQILKKYSEKSLILFPNRAQYL